MKFIRCLQNAAFISIILFFSCSSKEQDIKKVLGNAKALSVSVIPHGFLMGNPYQITIAGDILFIADNLDDKALVLYDAKNKAFLGRQLTIGQGPNEIIPPLSLGRLNEADMLSVLQRRNGRFARYKRFDLVQGIVAPKDTLTIENTDRMTPTSNGLIAAGEYENGSIRLLDSNGSVLNEINIYPDYIKGLRSVADKYIFGQGHVAFNKQSNVFAFAASFTGEALFYQLEGKSLKILKGYDFSLSSALKSRISNASASASIGESDIQYFSDVFSTQNHFYLLFSGVPMKERRTAGFSYVFKFSSKGDFLESYKTDIKLLSMCVADDDSKIYGIGLSKDFDYVLVEIAI